MTALTASPAWQALQAHAGTMRGVHLRELFAHDPQRFSRFSLRLGDLLLDYSKNRVDAETMRLLLDLAASARRRRLARPDVRRARRSTSPRAGPSCTRRCATARAARSWSTARTSCPRSHAVLDKMRAFTEQVSGRCLARLHRQAHHATSSTSASAAPTWAR